MSNNPEGMEMDLEDLLGMGGVSRSQTFPGHHHHHHSHRSPKHQKVQDATVERDLPISLEDIARGVEKKMKISRRVYNDNGTNYQVQDKVLTISVKPGWKAGTKITFAKEGDVLPGGKVPADIAFIIKDKPHPIFARDGQDIVYTCNVPLRDALCGTVVQVPSLLGGKSIGLNLVDKVIQPNSVHRISGGGLPYSKDPSKKGDLVVKFNVLFPDKLDQGSKDILYDVLGK